MSKRLFILAVLVAGAAIALISGPGRRAMESAWLLYALGTSTESADHTTRGDIPPRQALEFSVEGRSYAADLYRADETPSAALLLVPGLAPDGKDDRRLVDLAVVLARADFAVLVPDIASLRAQRVSAENIRQIADVLSYMDRARTEILPAEDAPAPIGIAAISYAVGPALLATLEPELRGRIDFMVAIGGYYDVEAVVTYFTTGFHRNGDAGAWVKGNPNDYGKWLFVGANTDAILDLRDRITLRAMAGRRTADGNAPIDDLVKLLGREGQAVYALLANQDPERARDLIAALPERLLRNLTALNIRGRDLTDAPRLILIHGRDDRIIPVSESLQLAAASPNGRAHLYVVGQLAHADLEPGDWRDILTLWQAAYRLLQLRDGAG